MASYLMWIGSAHYGTISDYSDEAIVQGVSKRVPNAAVAKAMMARDSMVFVAHDEGEKHDCAVCSGVIECPSCRKLQTAINNEQERVDAIRARIGELAPSKSQARTIRILDEKIAQWGDEIANCEDCDGTGHVESGTGGHVVLKSGEKWDYRRYVYWRNCGKRDVFDYQKDVKEAHMCPACGGFGTLPDGKVFGVFVPERIEYIVAAGDSDEKLAAMSKLAKLISPDELKLEDKRRCGYRHPGGVYVVTDKSATSKKTAKALKALKASGVDTDAAEVHGSFIKLPDPIAINERRFRGIKRWEFVPAAATAAAADIHEALA